MKPASIELTPDQAAFWQRFCAATGHKGLPLDCDSFGGPDIADDLLELVQSGRKRATCTNARWIEKGLMAMPRPGGLAIVTDARGEPACVIRTRTVEIRPFNEVTPHFAWAEGEGNRLLYDWKKAHRNFFRAEARANGYVFRETDPCVFETFEVAWQG